MIEGETGKVTVGINDTLIHYTEALTNKVILHIGTDIPLVFEEETPLIKTTTIVAPIVTQND